MGRRVRPERGKVHRGRLADRNAGGERHLHRWQPECSCGWRGIPAKGPWARDQLRRHRDSVENARIRGAGAEMIRQPLTPTADLPEALR